MSDRPEEKDTTGGLNNPEGSLVIYLPLSMQPGEVYGRLAYWIRCRFEPRRRGQGLYSESPRITNLMVHTLGATTWATHAQIVEDEILGQSNGEPGQVFYLQNSPALDPVEGETVEVRGGSYGDDSAFVPWESVKDFSNSTPYDRHFLVDTAMGQIHFGPMVRQPDGTMRQYGRIPETNREIRFTRYRYGGGTVGNVPASKLQVLKTSVAYIDRVTNLDRASGGRDQESLEEAKTRAQRELRAQLRAVTPQDYEDLALGATRSVSRVKCNMPQTSKGRLAPGVVEILVVPAVADSIMAGDLSKLHLDEALIELVEDHLDKYRLLTTTLRIKEPKYIGIKVNAEIVPSEFSQPEMVRTAVLESLRNFITPVSVGYGLPTDELAGDDWDGWPFGRNLYIAEIFSLIQRVPGVKHVLDVTVSRREVLPSEESLDDDEADVAGEEGSPSKIPPLKPVKRKSVRVSSDTLLCSLQHEIKLADLSEYEEDEDEDDDE